MKLIQKMRRRNPKLGIIELWARLKSRGYSRCVESLWRVLRREGLLPEKAAKKKYTPKPPQKERYPFTGLIVCAKCGKHYRRKVTATGPVWICSTYNSKGKAACPSKQIPEPILMDLTADMALGDITEICAEDGNRLVFSFADGHKSVKQLATSKMTLPGRTWEHLNVWDCPYKMKFDAAEVSQIIIRYDGMYRRCIRAKFTDLCYEGTKGEWRPVGSVLFGNASVIEFNSDTGSFENLLYVQEDVSDTKEQLETKLDNPDEIILDRICDEVFGDG